MVSLGVLLLILWLACRMALLSWADLSYVLPVTSVGYVLVALAGRIMLNEQISAKRWLGILLIMGGVALVGGSTAPQTTKPKTRAAGAGG
jgi:drug/metabolite transporter (DMT)-like permease